MLPVSITPYYMSLICRDDPRQPLRRTVIPTATSSSTPAARRTIRWAKSTTAPCPGLVHRYPDRVLLLVLDFCSSYCRYCTRSRVVGHGEIVPSEERLEQAFDYIRRTPAIRDVLLSGGDPLFLSDERLDWILTRLRAIPHVEFVRIGTKMPAVLPQRITRELCRVLRKHHPLWMSLHFTHPDECTPETFQACTRLADAGIPLGSQTVLLRGVNDNVETMKRLMHGLLKMRVRPYYLYQCDPITGSSHFRTPVSKGLEIIEGLRGHTTGYAVPTYVIDAPGGGGKIPLQPNYVVGREGDDLLLAELSEATPTAIRTPPVRGPRRNRPHAHRPDLRSAGRLPGRRLRRGRDGRVRPARHDRGHRSPRSGNWATRPTASATAGSWSPGWPPATAGTWCSTSPRGCTGRPARPRCRRSSTSTRSPTRSPTRWCWP